MRFVLTNNFVKRGYTVLHRTSGPTPVSSAMAQASGSSPRTSALHLVAAKRQEF